LRRHPAGEVGGLGRKIRRREDAGAVLQRGGIVADRL